MAKQRNKKEQELINNNMRNLFNPCGKYVINSVMLDTGNSLEHELKKAELCYNLQKEGRTYICEAKLKTGGKPDILVIDLEQPITYEIMKSESDKSITEKEAKYNGIRISKVKI